MWDDDDDEDDEGDEGDEGDGERVLEDEKKRG